MYASWRWLSGILASKLWSCIFINFKMMPAASRLVSQTRNPGLSALRSFTPRLEIVTMYASWRFFLLESWPLNFNKLYFHTFWNDVRRIQDCFLDSESLGPGLSALRSFTTRIYIFMLRDDWFAGILASKRWRRKNFEMMCDPHRGLFQCLSDSGSRTVRCEKFYSKNRNLV